MNKRDSNHFKGCLIGGAIGDALGCPIEFMKIDEIIYHYGSDGIQDLQISSSGKAEITDDTQMTLFTAEGVLRSETRLALKGITNTPTAVFFAYQRWLSTQGYPQIKEFEWIYDGWLLGLKEIYARRAPGNSCLSALISKKRGTIEEPINNSKGCGGVMRVAPAGLFYQNEDAFQLAIEFAALTHGHPTGYLSAGALAYLIANIIEGQNIERAVEHTVEKLKEFDNHEECKKSLETAIELSKSNLSDLDAISQLGEGWVGEEALAISIYSALKYQDDFKKALITAVNHNGDSDSTGAITGNILGVYLGLSEIPDEWIEKIELKDAIMEIADDLLIDYDKADVNWNRYPGY